MRYFDINAWLGEWPFRSLRDNTPDALIARLERAGIGSAAVSQIEGLKTFQMAQLMHRD